MPAPRLQPGYRHPGSRLVTVEPTSDRRHGAVVWLCRCDCGALHRATAQQLCHKSRAVRSCGCLAREQVAELGRRAPRSTRVAGGKGAARGRDQAAFARQGSDAWLRAHDVRPVPSLRFWRLARGLLLCELAGLAGMTCDNLSRLEHGRSGAKALTRLRLAEALDVDPRELLE
jgi:DNA-binding Xre family transcriptional regulator